MENQNLLALPELKARSISQPSNFNHQLYQKQGWLRKRTSKLIKRWQWRFFILKQRTLFYYLSNQSRQPRCTLNFDQLTLALHIKSQRKFKLHPLGSNRAFKLKAKTHQECLQWTQILQQQIQLSEGFLNHTATVGVKSSFWRFPRISHQYFKEQVNTGDLLLFTSKDLIAKFQRGLTRCKYDHVGMLVKNAVGEVGLFQATGQQGVTVIT